MGRMQLSLETLKDFDLGKAEVAFRKVLETVVHDLRDRGFDQKSRSVTLEMVLEPVLDEATIDEANVHFRVKAKLPALSTAPRPVQIDRQGHLAFNDLAPDNPQQKTLDEP